MAIDSTVCVSVDQGLDLVMDALPCIRAFPILERIQSRVECPDRHDMERVVSLASCRARATLKIHLPRPIPRMPIAKNTQTMSSRTTLPPSLIPYLRTQPETSLVLLTSTLSTSSTWLTSRFVSARLAPTAGDLEGKGNAVVLVSWLRDEKFWRGGLRRGGVCLTFALLPRVPPMPPCESA